MTKIAILGAGISGISLAWYLKKRYGPSCSITLFEKEEILGGMIRTEKIGEALFEKGPHTFRKNSSEEDMDLLLQELGIEDAVVEPSKEVRTKYIVSKGKLIKIPETLFSLFTSELGRLMLAGMVRDVFTRKKGREDESVADFFARRCGKQFVSTFIDPLVAGIWAGDPSTLSVRTCFPSLVSYEKTFGSLLKGAFAERSLKKRKIFSFHQGTSFLIESLIKKIDAAIINNCEVHRIIERQAGVEIVTGNTSFSFDFVFSALPAPQISCILDRNHPLQKPLHAIPHVSLAVVALGYKEKELSYPGFGCLCPSSEEKEILGCVFDSSLFPLHNGSFATRLSVMCGGARAPYLFSHSESLLSEKAISFVRKYLQIGAFPDTIRIYRAPQAIAQHPVGYAAILKELEGLQYKRRLQLLGSSFYGSAVPDCIASSRKITMAFSL